ncbi:hypothetical protein [Campylobacter rectus]
MPHLYAKNAQILFKFDVFAGIVNFSNGMANSARITGKICFGFTALA